jgi:hypothetical protein
MSVAQHFLDAAIAHERGIRLDPAKLAHATRAFDAALRSGDPATVTHELLSVAFFFEMKKGARAVALELVATARRAIPLLARAGVAFEDLAGRTERAAAALLAQTPNKFPVASTPDAGARWWQIR